MKSKKLLSIFLLLASVVAFVFAILTISRSIGYYESSYSYGGDAYTGIQNASAQTANNIRSGNLILKRGFTGIFFISGVTLLGFGLSGLLPNKPQIATEVPRKEADFSDQASPDEMAKLHEKGILTDEEFSKMMATAITNR